MLHPNDLPAAEQPYVAQLAALSEQVAEQLSGKKKKKPCYTPCPHGCPPSFDLAEPGYCPHLVGFSADGETVELRDLFFGRERVGAQTRPREAADQFVPQIILGRVSNQYRVYRADGEAPLYVDTTPPALNKAVLQKRIAQMREDLDRLEAKQDADEAPPARPAKKEKTKAAA